MHLLFWGCVFKGRVHLGMNYWPNTLPRIVDNTTTICWLQVVECAIFRSFFLPYCIQSFILSLIPWPISSFHYSFIHCFLPSLFTPSSLHYFFLSSCHSLFHSFVHSHTPPLGVAQWVARQTCKYGGLGFEPHYRAPLFHWARNFSLIAQYWFQQRIRA